MRSRVVTRCLTVAALVASAPRARGQTAAAPVALVQSGTLSFSAHATVGDFTGSTTTIRGAVTGDVADARGWVEAPVATLVTLNDHRDRDLRASMEAEKFPTMRFTLARAKPSPTNGAATVLHGALTIHGVTRDVDLPATIERTGDTIHVTSSFPLDLREYRIGGLKKMLGMLRMDPHIEVHVDLRFAATSSVNP